MNTDRELSHTHDRDLPRKASAQEIDALQRAVRRAQARLASTRPDGSNIQEMRDSLDRLPLES